jgi:hypothetical protein
MEDVAELYQLVRDKVNPKTAEEEAELFSIFYSIFRKKLPIQAMRKSIRNHAVHSMMPEKGKNNTSLKAKVQTDNVPQGQKRCPKCGEIKDVETGFSKYTSGGRTRVQGYCRDCNKARIADYNKRKKEKHQEELVKANPTLAAF